eukprot:CAMPEP_0198733340 /NCGR_PEP_ID=MMETSP1475-20131203/44948_1 /TAXON_ID= ORGANISM="Unidentified sp., Strain CCMP1999" /NCGR_SAMPLE_ID=MMETSP1475 /ASSEMBLY_ACC=CAM_ASM_001111 /LENGTH=59 /DNA_ID=CAMNT_0044496623 /DNA_START=101 /DNA_END=277 /DNA_ORIENTATION=+
MGHKDHVNFVEFCGSQETYSVLTMDRDGTLCCWCFRQNEVLGSEAQTVRADDDDDGIED